MTSPYFSNPVLSKPSNNSESFFFTGNYDVNNVSFFIGPPNSGKTVTIKYICKKFFSSKRIHYIIVFCSVAMKDKYSWLPDCFVHTVYSDDLVEKILEKQAELIADNPNIHCVVIFDDISKYKSKFSRSNMLESLFTEHKNFNITIFVALQSPAMIKNPAIIASVTHAFIYYMKNDDDFKETFKCYSGSHKNWKQFKATIQKSTTNHRIVVYVDSRRSSPFLTLQHCIPSDFLLDY